MTFKENASNELLTVLPADEKGILAFLCAAAKQAGSINICAKRKNLVFALSSYAECLAVVDMLKVGNYFLESKYYSEISSSNNNHPNDFMHRVYAMNIMSVIYDYKK